MACWWQWITKHAGEAGCRRDGVRYPPHRRGAVPPIGELVLGDQPHGLGFKGLEADRSAAVVESTSFLRNPGMRPTLSIPDHPEVKRTIIASLIKLAGCSEEEYLEAFPGK
jgi:hypothetical protein